MPIGTFWETVDKKLTDWYLEADAVIYREGDYAVAKVRGRTGELRSTDHAELINNVIDMLPESTDEYRFNGGGVIVLKGEFEISKPIQINKDNVCLIGYQSKLKAISPIEAVIYIGVTKQVYRVRVIGLNINCNNMANAGIRAYPSADRGIVDSLIAHNTIINAIQNGIDGYYYNSLIFNNVCNFNTAGIVVQGGQHVTLLNNTTYMNKSPGVIVSLTDTAFIIRHKSLSDNLNDTFWRCAIALNGLKIQVLSNFEIYTSNASALYYAVRIWPKNVDDYFFGIISNGMIRDEGDVVHQSYVRFEAYNDKHIAVIENVDARQADNKYTYSFEIVNDYGILITRNFKTSLSPKGTYLHRWVQEPHRFLSSCSDLPPSGIEPGQSAICYDPTAAKWVLKVWDGSAWQTIG